jgi:hypothetical protein
MGRMSLVMGKSFSTEEFIQQAQKKHGDKYDYSQVNYLNSHTKITLGCNIHGSFEISPSHHMHRGQGCAKCAKENISKILSLTNLEFIEKSEKIHGKRYDYSLVEYVNNHTKVKILCKEHGLFEVVPMFHLTGGNCSLCAREQLSKKLCRTTKSFVEQATKIFNGFYFYDKTNYIKNNIKIVVTCSLHGDFETIPSNHLFRGGNGGCPTCVKIKMAENSTGWTVTKWQESAKTSKSFHSFQVYLLKLWDENENFYKIGRTYTKIEKRAALLPYFYEVINLTSSQDAALIYTLENKLKKVFRGYKYTPLKKFNGMGECFKFDDPTIQSVIRQMTLTSPSDIIPTLS